MGRSRVIGGLAAAGLLFGVFARIERRGAAPLLDLSLLRYRRFLGIQLLAAAPAYAFVVLFVLLPMRFAGIEGMGAGRAGWMMAALSAPLLVLPLAAGRLARRWFRAGGADQARLPGAAQGHPVAQLLGGGAAGGCDGPGAGGGPACAGGVLRSGVFAAGAGAGGGDGRDGAGRVGLPGAGQPAAAGRCARGRGRKTGAGEGNRTLV
ncbi:hypothetical protein GO496_12820 [Acidovorax citrulli]|nr:hypothetical protein [Paracidovorax citrulli]